MKVKQLDSEQEWKQIVNLRRTVFIKEQGVPPELELDGKDKTAVHFLVKEEGKVVATCRLRDIDKQGKVERMAVKQNFRRQGIGSKLLAYVVQYAKANKLTELRLHAQVQAVEFYQQQGFQVVSSEFIQEAGIDHLEMKQEL